MSPVQQQDTSAVTSVMWQKEQEHRKEHFCQQIQSWPLQGRHFSQMNGSIWYFNEGVQKTLEISQDMKINNFSG